MASPRTPAYLPPEIDATKATLAFGLRQIPKLREELQSPPDLVTLQRALRSLHDISFSIMRVNALIDAEVPDALISLLNHSDDTVRTLVTAIFETLSVHVTARQEFLKVGTAAIMITKFDDSVSRVRTSAYNTVLNLCSSIPGVQAIIDCSMVPILVTNLAAESEDIQLIILDILHCCSPVNGQLTLSCGGLQTALSLMGSGSLPALRAKATRTVMELCNSAEGKVKACDEVTLIPRLVELLGDNESDVRTAAAGALMVIVVTTRGKFCVLEADGLEALLKLTASSEDQHTILNSVKALTCLAEAAQGRKQLLNHLDQFTPLKRHPSRAVVEATNTAIKVITWKP